jgi:hypothetical protein
MMQLRFNVLFILFIGYLIGIFRLDWDGLLGCLIKGEDKS